MSEMTPAAAGYFFPAEFALHTATWLSWPHNPDTWPGKIDSIYPSYAQFIKTLIAGEYVHINVADAQMQLSATQLLMHHDVPMERIGSFIIQPMTPGAGIMVRHSLSILIADSPK